MRYILILVALLIVSGAVSSGSYAENPIPQAPADISWLPHGYGNTMHVINSPASRLKGMHGFRPAPEYIGSWGQPLWGWDVNGYYRGPQQPDVDPVSFQLPIGLIYPDNAVRLGLTPPPLR